VLKTGILVVVLDKVSSVIIWAVMLMPAFALSYLLPSAGTLALVTAFVTAALLAGGVRAAFVKPLFLTMVMIKFHTEVHNQPINETWDARLQGVSDKFSELKEKAIAWGTGQEQVAGARGGRGAHGHG
jgi:cell division protein FtsW (lipid II flippase)